MSGEARPDHGFGSRLRLVVFGASNVRLAWRELVATCCAQCPVPFDLYLVMGHGRSLYRSTTFLGRRYAGLLESCLWEALDRMPQAPTLGLFMDVGNDILYGESAERIGAWCERMIDRMVRTSRVAAVATLPIGSIESVGVWRFYALRTALWPRSQVSRNQCVTTAASVDRMLTEAARCRGIATVVPCRSWYGWDPVHVRRRCRKRMWEVFLAPWWASIRSASEPARQCIDARDRTGSCAHRRWRLPPPLRTPGDVLDDGDARRAACALKLDDGSTIRFVAG